MITLVLYETPDGGILCTVKAKGIIMLGPQRADSWTEALEWAAAMVDDPTDTHPGEQEPPEGEDGGG